jgi:hypothetical protein
MIEGIFPSFGATTRLLGANMGIVPYLFQMNVKEFKKIYWIVLRQFPDFLPQ